MLRAKGCPGILADKQYRKIYGLNGEARSEKKWKQNGQARNAAKWCIGQTNAKFVVARAPRHPSSFPSFLTGWRDSRGEGGGDEGDIKHSVFVHVADRQGVLLHGGTDARDRTRQLQIHRYYCYCYYYYVGIHKKCTYINSCEKYCYKKTHLYNGASSVYRTHKSFIN